MGSHSPVRLQVERIATGWVGAGLILAVFLLIAVTSAARKSSTFDECFHLAGGHAIWRLGDYRLAVNADNGIAPKMWAGLPLQFMPVRFPDTTQDAWLTSDQLEIGQQFLFGCGNDGPKLVLAGRAMMAALAALIGALVYAIARGLFGQLGGIVALLVYAFSPAILAHGRLITSDVAIAGAYLAVTASFWRCVHTVSVRTIAYSAIAAGIAGLCKMSAVVLAPIILVLAVLRVVWGSPARIRIGRHHFRTRRRRALLFVVLIAIIAQGVVLVTMIWAAFGFRYSMYRAADRADTTFWNTRLESEAEGSAIAVIRYVEQLRLLPEGFLKGATSLLVNTGSRSTFMDGVYSTGGSATFFPYVVGVKTPTSVFGLVAILVAGSVVLARRHSRTGRGSLTVWLKRRVYRTSFLWIPAVVYSAIALSASLNIGERHLLPAYLPCFVLIGGLGAMVGQLGLWFRLAVTGLVSLLVATALLIWPNYLTFFNLAAGGPAEGYRRLVDSSSDWGQDLPALREWTDRYRNRDPVGRVYLSYFGTADPDAYGVETIPLPSYAIDVMPLPAGRLEPGAYCISATQLQGLYLLPPGSWTEEAEARFRDVARVFDIWIAAQEGDPNANTQWTRLTRQNGAQAVDDALRWFSALRLARLCAFLRGREPNDQVGHSILVFYLSQKELDDALHKTLTR